MTAYRVTARRFGEWWALEVPDLPGVFSQAKRLDKADEAAREAIAVMLDVETEDVEVAIEPILPPKAAKAIRDAEAARRIADQAADAAQKAMQEAAATLTEGLSQRDAGRVLGVSFQRVSQLLKKPAAAAPAKGSTRRSTKRATGDQRKKTPRNKELTSA